MAGFNSASTVIKTVFILVIIALLLHLIGFATPYWISSYFGHSGLWRACARGYGCGSYGYKASWFEATQAFETLGFIAAVAALVLIILYVFVPATSGKRIVFILCMLACFAAAGCIILGIIIFGAKSNNLSWSYALSTIAGIIFGVSGILLIVDMLKR